MHCFQDQFFKLVNRKTTARKQDAINLVVIKVHERVDYGDVRFANGKEVVKKKKRIPRGGEKRK